MPAPFGRPTGKLRTGGRFAMGGPRVSLSLLLQLQDMFSRRLEPLFDNLAEKRMLLMGQSRARRVRFRCPVDGAKDGALGRAGAGLSR